MKIEIDNSSFPPIGTIYRRRKDVYKAGYHTHPQQGIANPDRMRSIALKYNGPYKDRFRDNILVYIGQGSGNQKDARTRKVKDKDNNSKLLDHMYKDFMVWIQRRNKGEYILSYGKLMKHEYKFDDQEGRVVNLYYFIMDTRLTYH